MKKVMLVFGTRPEAIKMCPLVRELQKRAAFQTVVCVTGQHQQMLADVLSTFGIAPDYQLSIMKERQTLFDITVNVLRGMEDILKREQPDMVLVQGDTSTTFAAALACFYCRIPVGHVEAGLRTYQMDSPFPEEFNRQTVSSIAGLHFAPTRYAADNLLREGCPRDRIFVTGNTGIDALRYTVRRDYAHPVLDWAADSRLVLMTAHRRENLGEPMRNMFRAVRQVLEEQPGVKIVYPIHKNPAVRQIACEILSNHPRIRLTEPLDVLDFHNFMAKSHLILTDSGGIQEEAPFLGKPVLVMRNTTERPEGIAAGTLKLVGTEEGEIYRAFTRLLTEKSAYEAMAHVDSPYGQGYASSAIADVLEAQL